MRRAHAVAAAREAAAAAAVGSGRHRSAAAARAAAEAAAAAAAAAAVNEEELSVDECVSLVGQLAEEVDAEVHIYAPGFQVLLPAAAGVAVLEYCRCCREAIEAVVDSFRTLSAPAVLLWRGFSAFQDTVGRLLPPESKERGEALELLRELATLFERCVEAWMDDQTSRFAEVLMQCMGREREEGWRAMPGSGVSASAVDLFQMFHDSIPQLFHLGLPVTHLHALSLAQKVDLFVMKYCNDVLTHHHQEKTIRLDPATMLPKFKDPRDQLDKMSDRIEEMFAGKPVARNRTDGDRTGKGKEEDTVASKMLQLAASAYRGCESTLLGADSDQGGAAAGTGSAGTPGKGGGGKDTLQSKSMESLDKLGSHMEKGFEKMFGGTRDLDDVDPTKLLPPKDKRLETLCLPSLCVRIKNLAWCKKQVEGLAEDMRILWAEERRRRRAATGQPDSEANATAQEKKGTEARGGVEEVGGGEEEEDLGPLFESSQMALDQSLSTLSTFVANKMVFWDLRDDFVARLYHPTPRSFSLTHILHQDRLDRILASVFEEITSATQAIYDQNSLWLAVLEAVFTSVVRAVEWCIIGDHMGRIRRELVPADAGSVMDDLTAVKNYFVQRDEQGNARGVSEVVAAERTAGLELAVNELLSESSSRLVELYYDRNTPDEGSDVVNRKKLVRVLVRRPDRDAREFIKEYQRKR